MAGKFNYGDAFYNQTRAFLSHTQLEMTILHF